MASFLRGLGFILVVAALLVAAWARTAGPLVVGLILVGAAALRHVRTFEGLKVLAGQDAARIRFAKVFLTDRMHRVTRWIAYGVAPLGLAAVLVLLIVLGHLRLLGFWAGFATLFAVDIWAQRALEVRCRQVLGGR